MKQWFVKRSRAAQWGLAVVALIAACVAGWWVDSARGCESQDEYSLRGACLLQVQQRARDGEAWAQWMYGYHLRNQTPMPSETIYYWHRKALAAARTGLELPRTLELYCENQVPGFEAATIEAAMLRVAQDHPDTHLRLLQLYLYPGCKAFDMNKASAQIPLLNQCAHLSVGDYLQQAQEQHYRISTSTRNALRAHLALCAQEAKSGGATGSGVQEVVAVKEGDVEPLVRLVEELGF